MDVVLRRPLIAGCGSGEPCASCATRPFSVCAAIDDHDIARLAAAMVEIAVERGRTFIHEGEPAGHFFNVTRGTAKLFKLLPDGRRQITGFAGRGYFLGLAVDKAYAFSAEAIDDVRVCRFSRPKMYRLMDDFPALEKRLLEVAANELVSAQEQMLLLGRKTARERLASFLLALCSPSGDHEGRYPIVHLAMNRGDIADYLGMTTETVSRTFSILKSQKVISMPSASDIRVEALEKLRAFATGGD
jgi:CRP/FNR family transcriptional regulator